MKYDVDLDKKILVSAKNVSLVFKIPLYRYDTLKERVINLLKRKKNSYQIIKAIDNLSFEIKQGESLGVIGHNGSGKSSLLRMVANIYKPTSGYIKTQGQIVLLSLGAGFDMEANAIDNIYISGALYGFSKKQISSKINSILEFAELEKFSRIPLKNYSSGMVSRLGFAIAINIHPDLLLVDEVLSVGDENFKQKCLMHILELKKSGVSILFVSHSIEQIRKICEKTLWIENSILKECGQTDDVCNHYLEYCKSLKKKKNI